MSAPELAIPGTFAEAVEWAKARGVVLPAEFYGAIADEAKGKAFTVSGLAGLAQIQTAMDSLTTALEMGETFDSWQSRMADTLELSMPHMETVFRNFVQQAYNAGRWKQFEKNAGNRPYLMFSAINDSRTTEVCRQRNGIIRRVDDPFWRRNSPQCHHNCRSTLIALTESQAKARSKGDKGLNQDNPIDPVIGGWGYKPSGEDIAAGLVTAIADAAAKAPASWLGTLLGFFAGGWASIVGWISKIFG